MMAISIHVRVLLVMSLAATLTATKVFRGLGDITKDIKKEVVAVARPVGSGVVGTLSSQCALVKETFGLQYEQIKEEKEPDLLKLTLEFRDNLERIVFEILTAPLEIPKSRIYHPNETLTIFVHGFTDDPTKDGFRNISDAFHQIGYFNVLALDGSSLIKWLYLRSTSYVRFMGEKLGDVLAAMVEGGLNPKKIHIIGHSLGAHISGFTGKSFYKQTGKRIGRISGLDPAGPCFVEIDEDLRLKKSDADFVDVIHTDAGVFGLTDPVGHVDFFPNGGNKQPDCIIPGCSHSRAWLYYAASVINPKGFPAVKCRDWDAFKKGECEHEISYMGYGCDVSTRGSFFLHTGDTYPYGLGDNGTRFNNDEAVVDKIISATKGLKS